MAANSKRERILVALEQRILTVPSFKAVKRTRPEFSELKDVPTTQMPFIALVGGLPQPRQKKSGRRAGATTSDFFYSNLSIDLYCYAIGGKYPDTTISDLADDLWNIVMTSDTLSGLITEITMKPEMASGYFSPYISFKLSSVLGYYHPTTNI